MKDATKLLLSILSIRSVNGIDDESKVVEYIYRYLVQIGIDAQLQRIDDKHANLMAFVPGESHEKYIVWNGHIDTVPYGDLEEWNTNPEIPVEIDGKIYARGASDMKSGVAAMVYALSNIVSSGKRPAYDILLLLTCDEEKNGLGATTLLNNNVFLNASEILIGEPTGLNIGIAQKGCLWLEFEVYGKTSHGAYPEQGINAVEYALKIAGELKKYISSKRHEILGEATAQITEISGGIAPNMTPDRCRLLMDIRLIPEQNKEDILRFLGEILEKYKKKTHGILQFRVDIKNYREAISMFPDDEFTVRLKYFIEKNLVETGYIGINYFTDGSIFLRQNPNLKILLFGPGESNLCHKANEYVCLTKYYKAIDILTSFALEHP